jgi:hypothetical protein
MQAAAAVLVVRMGLAMLVPMAELVRVGMVDQAMLALVVRAVLAELPDQPGMAETAMNQQRSPIMAGPPVPAVVAAASRPERLEPVDFMAAAAAALSPAERPGSADRKSVV